MSKKDYEKAAEIVQNVARTHADVDTETCDALCIVTNAFVKLFVDDNPHFDEDRFRAACIPGANVKARKVKVKA